jgi:hypothetical protein
MGNKLRSFPTMRRVRFSHRPKLRSDPFSHGSLAESDHPGKRLLDPVLSCQVRRSVRTATPIGGSRRRSWRARSRARSDSEARAHLGDYFAEVLLLGQDTNAAKARAEVITHGAKGLDIRP